MKKSVANLLSGALVLTAIMSVSCGKDLADLTLDLQTPVEGGEFLTISQGETLEIPFTVGSLEGFTVTAEATCDNDDYTTVVKLDGNGASGTISLTAPELIFEDASLQITLTINDAANSRTVTKTINVNAASVLENLAASNCHLTSPAAFIRFPAVKGNSSENLTFAAAELLWEDASGLIDDIFTREDNAIYVKVAEDKEGNAVVCAKDSEGTIVWSWHIWVSEEDATANTMSYTYTKEGNSTTYHFMDRNVGALTSELGTADVNGCFYQWGRKDPFPASDYEGGLKTIYDKNGEEMSIETETTPNANNIQTAIQNPTTRYTTPYSNGQSWITDNIYTFNTDEVDEVKDLWGFVSGTKTIYDPCPAGYRMPVTDAWRFYNDSNVSKQTIRDEEHKPVGVQITIDSKDFFIPGQGNISPDNYEIDQCLKLSYHPGTNDWKSCARHWLIEFLESDFRAYTTEVDPASVRYWDTPEALAESLKTPGTYSAKGYSDATSYSRPIRCIKE